MENLYAVRDAFFWWAGVWVTVTSINHGVLLALRRRRSESEAKRLARYADEFVAGMMRGFGDEPDAPESDASKANAETEAAHDGQ